MTQYDLPADGQEMATASGFPTLSILEQKSTQCQVVQFTNVPYELVLEIAKLLRAQLPKQIQAAGFELASPLFSIHHKITGESASEAKVNLSVGYAVERIQEVSVVVKGALVLELPSAIKELLVSAELKSFTLPAGRVAALSYFHSKNEMLEATNNMALNETTTHSPVLFAAWENMLTKITDRGLSPLAPMWEVYAPSRTDLFVPLGWSIPPVV